MEVLTLGLQAWGFPGRLAEEGSRTGGEARLDGSARRAGQCQGAGGLHYTAGRARCRVWELGQPLLFWNG